MTNRIPLGKNVYEAAVDRIAEQYSAGHRLVVSFSGGKDSTVALECSIEAARRTGRLPVEVVMRDEEIAYPGTYEFCERTAARPEVALTWLVARMPIINCFDRTSPYWWCFDPTLDPGDWVRPIPPGATHIPEINIQEMTTPGRFPVTDGQTLMSVLGLRVQESQGRMYGLHSSGGPLTKPTPPHGVRLLRPIYDWTDGDVWLAIRRFGWDYSGAYDQFHRAGIPRKGLRIGPPTMNPASIKCLAVASQIWPQWYSRVIQRLPSVRTAVQFGSRVLRAERRHGETWETTFNRECIDRAPEWIAERAARMKDVMLRAHKHHSTSPFPEVEPCYTCHGSNGSWKRMTLGLYLGDPFSIKFTQLPYVEPEAFRPGAGTWSGKPGF